VPGFGFSSAPRARGWTVKETAALIDTLMTRVLGYRAYLAQGGDWVRRTPARPRPATPG
jgi:hypothetical protein